MKSQSFELNHTGDAGLRLRWGGSLRPNDELSVKLRVVVEGHHIFRVWNSVDSGEEAPEWADEALRFCFFDGEISRSSEVAVPTIKWIGETNAVVTQELGGATCELSIQAGESHSLEFGATLHTKAGVLPLCRLQIVLDDWGFAETTEYLSGHAYGGRTYNAGRISDLSGEGVHFVHGCIGLGAPVLFLGDGTECLDGYSVEFALESRPVLWLAPSGEQGTHGGKISLELCPDRLIRDFETYYLPGRLRIARYSGPAIRALQKWTRERAALLGYRAPGYPHWMRDARIIEFNMGVSSTTKDFVRLDDPQCREMLVRWKKWGFNTVMAISQFDYINDWLGPIDYRTSEILGGERAEATCLRWMHELGFHVVLWVTTVGVDKDSEIARLNPDWFTRRRNGHPFYAWASSPATGYVGYAPDADPLSSGWCRWLKSQICDILERGYDGIFIDGCIPRSSNHSRAIWPGEARNAVESQVSDLVKTVEAEYPDRCVWTEDESLVAQSTSHCVAGRYVAMRPFRQTCFWDIGMGGGTKSEAPAPERIPFEKARDYLRQRYASHLPGVLAIETLEGYYTEETRPWIMHALFSGHAMKSHSEYLEDLDQIRPWLEADPPTGREAERGHRESGREEFFEALRLRGEVAPTLFPGERSLEAVEVLGDPAVVGMLRIGKHSHLLILTQFAPRAADIKIRLAQAQDARVPADLADQVWRVRELQHARHDTPLLPLTLHPGESLSLGIASFSFRILSLEPASSCVA